MIQINKRRYIYTLELQYLTLDSFNYFTNKRLYTLISYFVTYFVTAILILSYSAVEQWLQRLSEPWTVRYLVNIVDLFFFT